MYGFACNNAKYVLFGKLSQYEALLLDSLIQITIIRHHFQPPTQSELTVYARRTMWLSWIALVIAI